MTDDSWKDITERTDSCPGPTGLFVSGYTESELETLRWLADRLGHGSMPVVPCTKTRLEQPLEAVFNAPVEDEPLGPTSLPRVCVFSGLSFPAIQTAMARFGETDLARPIFATTTPTNLAFKVKALLRHLLEEQRAMSGDG